MGETAEAVPAELNGTYPKEGVAAEQPPPMPTGGAPENMQAPADQQMFMMQQQQMYMMQQQYMYPGAQPNYSGYQTQWNQYPQYQQYQQQQMYEQPAPNAYTAPPYAATPEGAPPTEPVKEKKPNNAWQTNKQHQMNEASVQLLSVDDKEDKGPKSWADIARDKKQQEENDAHGETEPEQEQGQHNPPPQHQQHQQRVPRDKFRGGKSFQQNRPRPAGRRGLTLQELQAQSQQLIVAQRLVASANQYRVDASFLYHTQMTHYAVYHYGSYVPMNYTTPGSVALDEHSYPFLHLLRLYPHLIPVNQTSLSQNPPHSKYFTLTCKNELEAHAGIKHARWQLPAEEATPLNQALGEVAGLGHVYFFVTVPGHKRCIGLAEMVSPAAPVEKPPKEENNKEGNQEQEEAEETPDMVNIPLRWICVKDIHLGAFRRANMLEPRPSSSEGTDEEQSESQNATKSSGLVHALDQAQGVVGMQVIIEQPVTSTMLLDFKMFDDASATGQMPSYYRPDFYLPGFPHRGGRSYGRGRGRSFNRGRGGSFRGTFRRGRGASRGRGGFRSPQSQETGDRRFNNQANQEGSGTSSNEGYHRDRPRRLVTGDGAEVSLDGKYQFQVQRKVKKGKKKKEDEDGTEETNEEGNTDKEPVAEATEEAGAE